jgi:hypothetical protein
MIRGAAETEPDCLQLVSREVGAEVPAGLLVREDGNGRGNVTGGLLLRAGDFVGQFQTLGRLRGAAAENQRRRRHQRQAISPHVKLFPGSSLNGQ